MKQTSLLVGLHLFGILITLSFTLMVEVTRTSYEVTVVLFLVIDFNPFNHLTSHALTAVFAPLRLCLQERT